MIHAFLKRNEENNIVSFEVTGHAESGAYGTDIVCAAVSALTIGTTNSLSVLGGFTPLVETNDEVEGGYLYVELPVGITGKQLTTTQILLESLLLSLKSIAEEYPNYVKLNYILD
ncbi:ribosomal-processing cysteine protease Prp [Carnobacterium funditum]|uniref:ribosomal-processing cysteine protease Prp n=1 Tax=Carnobacterium funditum TaxID=2752 RepID=UPI0005506E6D|nr:ribosomal-processing cysteine protease Prp [Carnobacterium funditum]